MKYSSIVYLTIVAFGIAKTCLVDVDCPCEVGSRGNIVINCMNRYLTSIPKLRLRNPDTIVEEINLSNNRISEVPAFSFNHSSLKHITSIDLSGNPIEKLHYNSFTPLESSLKELLLTKIISRNFYIVSVPFNRLLNLEKIVISNFRDMFLSDSLFINSSKLQIISLKEGQLSYVHPSTFGSLQNTLQELDLSKNKLKEVPALQNLKQLHTLSLSHNPIRFKRNSFLQIPNLKNLKIDHTTNQIDEGAFSGLGTLEMINVKVNRWDGASFSHLKQLKNLNYIDASFNQITKITPFLDGHLENLRYLNLENNRIEKMGVSTTKLTSRTLQVLNLENNPLIQVHPDTFRNLPSLKRLNLKNAVTLNFSKDSFVSQKGSLESLSISSSQLVGEKWQALMQLQSLRQLHAANCNLPNIPDFTFSKFSKLENLLLDENNITKITQLTFIGLEKSLTKLSLSSNNLSTIDKCSLEGLQSMNILDLKIDNNPLKCDCDMEWLFEKINSLRKNPKYLPLVAMLQWKCHNFDILFKDLQPSHFSLCTQVSVPCETIPLSTLPPRSTSRPSSPYFSMFVSDVTSKSFTIAWKPNVTFYEKLQVKCFEASNNKNVLLDRSFKDQVREYKLSNLNESTEYVVSVSMLLNENLPPIVLTEKSKTLSRIEEIRPAIIGGCVGVMVVFILLVIAVCCVCAYQRKPKKPMVEVTDQSRRFVKYNDSLKSSGRNNYKEFPRNATQSKVVEPLYTDEVIKSTLDKMTYEEKYKLVNLLTKSTEGLNDKTKDYSKIYKGEYDKIPANLYEEIEENTFLRK